MQDESGKAAPGSPAGASATTAQVGAEEEEEEEGGCYSGLFTAGPPNTSLCVGLTHMLGSKNHPFL